MSDKIKARLLINQYIKENDQIIILISGLSGTDKKQISMDLANYFDLMYINHTNYLNKDYDSHITLSNNHIVESNDDDNYIDWNKFNEEINLHKSKGIIVSGPVFPTELLKFKTDLHINLFISKQSLKDNVQEFIEKHPNLNLNIEDELLKINTITYKYFVNSISRSLYSIVYDVSKYDNLHEIIKAFITTFLKNNVDIIPKIDMPENIDIHNKNLIDSLKKDENEYKRKDITNDNILEKDILINDYQDKKIHGQTTSKTTNYPFTNIDEENIAVISI